MNIDDNIQLTKQGFEASFAEADFYRKQTTDNSHLELLLSLVNAKAGETILDLGTGTGYIAFALAERNPDSIIIGLDITAETLEQNGRKAAAKNLHGLSFLSYDGKEFPFPDCSIDTIVTRYALHHFPAIEFSFHEMYRILKPNGTLILSDPTPNDNDVCGFVDRFMQMKADGHVRFYRLREYQKMLERIGFQLISNQTTTITFPRKEASKYASLTAETNQDILTGYGIKQKGDEIWITENVLNIKFIKRGDDSCFIP